MGKCNTFSSVIGLKAALIATSPEAVRGSRAVSKSLCEAQGHGFESRGRLGCGEGLCGNLLGPVGPGSWGS